MTLILDQLLSLGLLLRDITECEDSSQHHAVSIADQRPRVFDTSPRILLRNEHGVVRKTDVLLDFQGFKSRILHGDALLVNRVIHLSDGAAFGIGHGPSGEHLGDGIHEDNISRVIRRNDPIPNRAQCGVEPLTASRQLLIQPLLVKRNLHRAQQGRFLKWFDDVA